MTLQLPEMTVDLLRQQAIGKGLATSTLAAMLLEMIVQDGLYDAVLDEHEAWKRPPGQRKVLALDETAAQVAAIIKRRAA